MRLLIFIVGLASFLSMTGTVCAQSTDPNVAPADCAKEIQATEAQATKDRAVVMGVAKAAEAGGMPAVNGRLEELLAVIGHMPTRELTQCDGKTYTRGMGSADILGALLSARGQAKAQVVVLGASPYPLATRLAGAAYLDRGDFAKADAVMKRGLALAPGDALLANEEALTLAKLHRPAEGLAIIDRAITGDALAPKSVQARLLRTRGYVLGDLGRFNEAIASYQDSLKIEPDNGLAKNEIAYLSKRKAGGAAQGTTSFIGDQSKSVVPQN